MKQNVIYALDFDGVICDSAVETGITGWKAAGRFWNDFPTPTPPAEMVDRFRRVRPIIETGYESILAMRMLFEGLPPDIILSEFEINKQGMLEACGFDIDELKRRFGETRDNWIKQDPDDWIGMNPLFPGVTEKLRQITATGDCYIVTTKQERFVKQILDANQIEIPAVRIFGLDRKMGKEQVLLNLIDRHPARTVHFVEDRLPTLVNVLNNDRLKHVKLFLADWGYNTEQDRLESRKYPIELIGIDQFIGNHAAA
ncbi:MAG: HAD family hydrolase [Gammaproteobacteria bacterium]